MTHLQRASQLGALFALIALATACGGGGGGGGGGGSASDVPSDLALVDVSVGGFSGVPLNEIIVFQFTEALDPDSVRADTIRIRRGPNFGLQVPGEFRVDGNRVEFYPQLPVLSDLSDSGLQPGTSYRMILPGAESTVATVRNIGGDRLPFDRIETFTTAEVGAGLFVDNFDDSGPPRVETVNPASGAVDVPTDAPLHLNFNRRPLLPGTVTPGNVYLTLVERDGVVLNRPVEGEPALAQSQGAVQVRWIPRFPLADRATYRLTVSRRTQDLVGNDVEPFESTFTTRDEPPRPGELVLDFDLVEWATVADQEETTASWSDAKQQELSALFTAAGGNGTAGDLAPTANVTLTPDDFPRGVVTRDVDGVQADVFNFRSIDIPAGVIVKFAQRPGGPNRPIVLVSLKDITVDGTIDVSGGRGVNAETNSRNSTLPLSAGGPAGPGGGDGADNYTGSIWRNPPRQDGDDGPLGFSRGGEGGGTSVSTRYSFAGGGGGGGSREDGKSGTRGGFTTSSWNGSGGAGGQGLPQNLDRRPNVAGGGGGAGGLGYYWPSSTNWRQAAAGGGGAGGAITLQSAGRIVIGSSGKILADGGDGGDTTPTTSSYYGGAGGGGGGGSVLIRATADAFLDAGATIEASGGKGGRYSHTWSARRGGEGGDGGNGYIRLEARADEFGDPELDGISTSNLPFAPSVGTFSPVGGGAPSVGQTLWRNLGVFDPRMVKPGNSDVLATLFNDEMTIEVQMTVEDLNDLGNPDLSAMDITDIDGDGEFDDTLDPARQSEWTRIQDIEALNGLGYQFMRVRVTFQLDDAQSPADPLPSIARLRLPYRF